MATKLEGGGKATIKITFFAASIISPLPRHFGDSASFIHLQSFYPGWGSGSGDLWQAGSSSVNIKYKNCNIRLPHEYINILGKFETFNDYFQFYFLVSINFTFDFLIFNFYITSSDRMLGSDPDLDPDLDTDPKRSFLHLNLFMLLFDLSYKQSRFRVFLFLNRAAVYITHSVIISIRMCVRNR